MKRLRIGVGVGLLLGLVGCAGRGAGGTLAEGTARSADGVPIHYRVAGSGDVALVFLHGWMGDASWWDAQIAHFAPRYRVVAIDLAGHGQSGRARKAWTVAAFARDVRAVADRLALKRIVLVGHSMSGAVSAEAARDLRDRVVALVPVDTLQNVEWRMGEEEKAKALAELRSDFTRSVRKFLTETLLAPTSPKDVADRLLARVAETHPDVALPILETFFEYDVRDALRATRVPIRAINADLQPTNLEVNRKYAADFEVILISGVGHWPMLEAPGRFNAALDGVLRDLGLDR
jgi:sigma-B regulation protein RsbQ